jgi:hypothetical protein
MEQQIEVGDWVRVLPIGTEVIIISCPFYDGEFNNKIGWVLDPGKDYNLILTSLNGNEYVLQLNTNEIRPYEEV